MTLTSSFLFSHTTSLRVTWSNEKESVASFRKAVGLTTHLLIRRHRVARSTPARYNPEVFINRQLPTHTMPAECLLTDQMHMNRMRPSTSSTLQDPVLNGTPLRLCKNAFLRSINPCHSVDSPLAALTFKVELMSNGLLIQWEVDFAELSWQFAIVACIRKKCCRR